MLDWIKKWAWSGSGRRLLSPAEGYARWAAVYESEDNLMQVLDRRIVEALLQDIDLAGTRILDFGCGTGRYWPFLHKNGPGGLTGCDISEAMLERLREKYPAATVHLIRDPFLPFQPAASVDLLFSTLTIGHVPELLPVLGEWNRVLRPGGRLLLTGNHPAALLAGAERVFRQGGRTYRIRNYVHSFGEVREGLTAFGWREEAFREEVVREADVSFFEKAGDLDSFYRIRGRPVVYGMRWKKPG